MDLSQPLKLYPLPWQDGHAKTQQMGALAINVWPHLDTVLLENRPHETPPTPNSRACQNLERPFCSESLSVKAMSRIPG